MAALHQDNHLSAVICVATSSRPSPSTLPPGLDTERIGEAAAEHLVAAAQAEHVAAAARMRLDVDVPTLLAQEREVADGRFRARQDDDIGVARDRLSGTDELEPHARLHAERIEIVEIRDARQHRHDDLERGGFRCARSLEVDGVLGRQPCGLRQPGHDAARRPAGEPVDRRNAVIEQSQIAA